MKEFLGAEGVTGRLHGRLPPGNSSDAWGKELWSYLNEVAILVLNIYFVVTLF